MDVIPEGYEDRLDSNADAHVATIGPKGEPQVNPVWFDGDGQRLKFSHPNSLQKYKNVGRDPRISSIVDPENHLRYLEVRGEVVRIEEDPDLDFIDSTAKQYLGVDKYPDHRPGDECVVLYVEPRHATKMG